jgi:hypothetical protein
MEKTKYAAIVGLLDDGYGPDLVNTLLDAVQQYGISLATDGSIGKRDEENLYNLIWLLKALLKDCFGVETD